MYMQHVDNLVLASLIKPNDKIIVAFSGGPDSVFLVKKLLELKKIINFEFSICYINHKLRKEVFEEESWIKEFAKKHQLKCYIKRVDVLKFSKERKISIETAGRILRYRILKHILKKEGYNKIATAHHLNDAFETFILNSIRGSGVLGLVLKPKYKNIIRPIILYSKDQILKYLKDEEYLVDRTNFEILFSRNFIRNEVISKISERFPNYIEGFRKTYLNLLEYEQKLKSQIRQIYKNTILYKDRDLKIFRRDHFLNLDSMIVKIFFSKIISEPSYNHLNKISKIIKTEGKLNISKNYFFEVRGNFIGIYKKPLKFSYLIYVPKKTCEIYLSEIKTKIIVQISQEPKNEKFTLNLNFYSIFDYVIIRSRKKGDKIGGKKLKEILIERKVPNFLKDFIPILEKNGQKYLPIKPFTEKGNKFLIIKFVFPKFIHLL